MGRIRGQIGALCIVVSLLFTILAGYGLNVNTTATTTDEYDYITDVSGLFDYSDEKQYIEYNPAKNYTGYTLEKKSNTIENYPQTLRMGALQPGESFKITASGAVSFKSSTSSTYTSWGSFSANASDPQVALLCSWGFICVGTNTITLSIAPDQTIGDKVLTGTQYVTVTYNNVNNTIDFYKSNTNTTYQKAISGPVLYWTNQLSYVSYYLYGTLSSGELVYVNNIEQLVYYCYDSTLASRFCGYGNSQISQWSGVATTYTAFQNIVQSQSSTVKIVNTMSSVTAGTRSLNMAWVAYPVSITDSSTLSGTGIDYTSQTALNNYKMASSTTTTTGTLALTSSLTQDNGGITYINLPNVGTSTTSTSTSVWLYNPYSAKLSTIISSMSLASSVTSVTFTNQSDTYITSPLISASSSYYADVNQAVFYTADTINEFTLYKDSNGNIANYNYAYGVTVPWSSSSTYYAKAVYETTNQTVQLYDQNNTLVGTYPASQVYVAYGGTAVNHTISYSTYGDFFYHANGNATITPTLTSNLYWTKSTTTNTYMNINDGVSINCDLLNYSATWSNGNECGDIQVLFRAPNTTTDYFNGIIASGSAIYVWYKAGDFIVDNGVVTKNVGNWRSIVLDINLETGYLSVIPVKNFVSFANVDLTDTSITIGRISTTPATQIYFYGTPASLTFSIYSTKVFMNTYGAVMVDPSIDVTDKFTTLNGFYRVNFNSFALYGSKMKINGTQYTVSDGKITISSKSYPMQNMNVTYHNNKTSVSFTTGDTIDLGTTTTNEIAFTGSWYFTTGLYQGSTGTSQSYTWDWEDFVLNNGQFVVIFLGLLAAAYLICRHYCTFSIIDYIVLVLAVVIVITMQVI